MVVVESVELPSYVEGPAQPEPVEVPTDNTNIPPLPSVAKQRAQKAAAGGVGEMVGKNVNELEYDFSAGREKDIRDQAAATIDLQRQKAKQQQLTAMAQKYGPLSATQVSQFLDPFAPQNANTDPDTVIEKQYAHSVIGTLATAPGFVATDNIMDVARREIPKQASQTEDIANDLTTKNQYLLKKMQDAQQLLDNQSTFGWIVDQAKSLTQVYPEVKQRGLVDGIYGVGLIGENLEEQSNALYRKAQPDFKSTVDNIFTKLAGNPSLLVSTLGAFQGQDIFEKTLNNIYSAMVIPDVALGGKVLKKVLTLNEIRKAAKDIVSAAAQTPDHDPAKLVAAVGDTRESATLKVARQVTDAMAGNANPLQTSKDTLLTSWKEIGGRYQENPGTYLTREAQTRYLDETAKEGAGLIDRISTMSRVERQPQSVVSADAIRAQKDKIRQDFRGPDAMLLDVDGPHIEPISNTKWYVHKLGDYDGSLFTDRATAEGRLESLKIAGNIEGKAGEKLYIPQAAAKDLESVKSTEVGTRFYVTHGVEVQSSPTPKPGFVPYNLKTNKFEPALTAESAHVEQQGLGFYIEHWTPLQETSDVSRNFMIRDAKGSLIPETIGHSSSTGTKSIVNSVLGWVRNSEETLAVQESIQRKAATYAQTNIHKWAAALNQPINKIQSKAAWWKPTAYLGRVTSREVQVQFEQALNAARQSQKWFKGPGELQDFYMRNFRRDPSPLETKAYFNYVKLIEGDRILGEIAEFRNRARVGAEQHRIRLLGSDGKPLYSDLFDGVSLTRLPSNDDQIFIVGDDKGRGGRVQETGRLNKKSRDEIEDKMSRGEAKLVEMYDIDHNPLDNFSEVTRGQRIRYVLSRNMESNPLEFNHVNKKEGGHFEWDYDHFIKQADMRPQKGGKVIYVGDKTVMPIDNKALGGNVAKLFNDAHELMKADKWDEIRPITAKLGIKHEDFISWYKAGEDGRPPKLNFHEPMVVVPKNKNVLSLDSALQDRYRVKDRNGNLVNRFEDGSRTGFANNFKVAYNTERHSDFNFRTINDIGSKENPIYQYQPAKLVDPLPTMNRALNRAISSAFMDDYKLYAIEHWLREAETHLEADGGIGAIRSAPFWYYHDPKFKASTPANVRWNLLSHKYKIDSFVGLPSKFDTWVHTFTEHLANNAYINYGPEEARTGIQKAVTIVPTWLLHHVKDPTDFIRSVTFNFKLGLFNPAQFLVQAQTHALIWSLEPRHGTVGTYGMLLHGWSRVNKNPAILSALDEYYTKLNMFGSNARPGEFLEGMRELEKTGFEHVAGEYANLAKSYMPTTNFLGGDVERGLKVGQTPFRLGEQSTRITAWYTAFRKFREENPTTAITNIERNKILQHADLLTVNMSRASSSMINHGVFAMSTQFLNYQIRLAELFLGKRTTMMDKARIMTGFSMLYGFPNAIGVTGAPISDTLRAHFMDDLGYIPGEKWTSTMLNEGFPAWTMAMITGKGDLQAGNLENTGNRFGSQGFQNIKQALRSDIPWYMAIGGAGASVMSNFMGAALDPFYQGVTSWARGDTGDSRFTVKGADLIQPLKEISTVNNGIRWWNAMQVGQWINKNEGYVEDLSALRATYLAVLGMNPQNQDDMFVKNGIIKAEEEAQKAAQKGAIKDWQRGLQAFSNGDPEQGNSYIKNAMARLTAVGYPYEEVLKFMAIASRGWESTIDQTDYSYWTRGDQSKRQERLDYVQRLQQMKDKQK